MSEAVPLLEFFQPDGDADQAAPAAAPAVEADLFVAAGSGDLQALVEDPCRTLEVEYKGWRNLNHAEDRAELARDIAALANHGGGYVVFGFCRETLVAEDTHPFWTRCSADQVAGVVRDYLDPPVRCEVSTLRSSAGNVHSIVRVQGHGAVPVCIARDGPVVGGEKLVERGAFYVRKFGPSLHGRHISMPRPESGRVDSPQDWTALIRRCVRQDRESLLAMIDAAVEGRRADPPLEQRLRNWHDAARAAFLALVPRSPVAEPLKRRHFALSYGFELIDRRTLERAQLAELLRLAAFEQRTTFRDVLNMFDPPYRRTVQARFVSDAGTGDEESEFLEVGWLRDRTPSETADFWRFSPSGMATILRDYAEDRGAENPTRGMQPGRWFSPNALAQEVAELVCHARILARIFGTVRRVCFRCEWWGLAGRELFDPAASWISRGPCGDDHRVVTLHMPAAGLAEGWVDVVAQLIAPVMRNFEPELQLTPDWVRSQMERWQSSGSM